MLEPRDEGVDRTVRRRLAGLDERDVGQRVVAEYRHRKRGRQPTTEPPDPRQAGQQRGTQHRQGDVERDRVPQDARGPEPRRQVGGDRQPEGEHDEVQRLAPRPLLPPGPPHPDAHLHDRQRHCRGIHGEQHHTTEIPASRGEPNAAAVPVLVLEGCDQGTGHGPDTLPERRRAVTPGGEMAEGRPVVFEVPDPDRQAGEHEQAQCDVGPAGPPRVRLRDREGQDGGHQEHAHDLARPPADARGEPEHHPGDGTLARP